MLPIRDTLPTRRFAWVTAALISINVAVFLFELFWMADGALERVAYTLGVVPYDVTHAFSLHVALTFLTSMFLHGGFMHVASNMLYLWIFGNNVEDVTGRFRFLLFYVLCGVVATSAQVYMVPNTRIPTIGASGAIAGVLGAYLVMFPRARVNTMLLLWPFIRVIQLPAILLLGLWFVLQLLSGMISFGLAGSSGIAWFAHIGGFLAGLVLGPLLRRRRRTA